MSKYDYLIVGSGLYGSIFAYETKKSPFGLIDLNGDSLGARTPDPLIKSQMGIMQIIQYL